jgi:hypothetical protein
VLRLSFVRLLRHLIGRDPDVVHFLVGASHVMGVAAWRYRQFANHAHSRSLLAAACAFSLVNLTPP